MEGNTLDPVLDMSDSCVSASHSPHNMCFKVKWSLSHSHQDLITTYDKISIHPPTTTPSSSLIYQYNRQNLLNDSCIITYDSLCDIEMGVAYTVCYTSAPSGHILAQATVTTISYEQEIQNLPGRLQVEYDSKDNHVLIYFDLSAVPNFSPSSSDSLHICREKDSSFHFQARISATGEVKGKTYFHVNTELKNGVNYNVRYLFDDNNIVGVSNVFQCSGLFCHSSCEECILTANFDPETCSVDATWEFPQPTSITVSNTQFLYLYRTEETSVDVDLQQYHYISIQTSGKYKGSVRIAVQGAVSNNETYTLRYVDTTSWTSYGSVTFTARDVSTSHSDVSQLSAAMVYNSGAFMRYMTQEAEEINDAPYNPILSVDVDKDYSVAQFLEEYHAASLPNSSEKFTEGFAPLSAEDLQQSLYIHLDKSPGVIYAGAGCSMDAPSCSPSWWRLMAELVRAVFSTAPEEHRPRQYTESDVSRQPEEIMESFYYILGEKLLTLFRALEYGRPNANHVAMAKLAKAGKIKAIFTTNFDLFIERALKEESVDFKAVVTNEEFEEYLYMLKSGTAPVAVLKIHGTVDRPETIVAVASHYKMDKGFSGTKAEVLLDLVQQFPVLFIGYSGWDFVHKNYQDFWSRVQTNGCRGLFWLKLLGFSGGPDLGRVVGRHVGTKLHIGAGRLPDFYKDILNRYVEDTESCFLGKAARVDATLELNTVNALRFEFMLQWVQNIHPTTLLSLVMIEGHRLNEIMQKSAERLKRHAGSQEVAESTSDMMAVYMQLALDLQSGIITEEEYNDRVNVQTMKTTFQYVALDKEKKEQVMLLCSRACRSHSLLKDNSTNQSMLGSLIMSISHSLPETASPQEYIDTALRFLQKVERYKSSPAARDKIVADTLLYCSSMLAGSVDNQQNVDSWIIQLADKAILEEWTDDKLSTERANLCSRITQLTSGTLDIEGILDTQMQLSLKIPESELNILLESCTAIALGLISQSEQRGLGFMSQTGFQQKVIVPLSMDSDATIPEFVFKEYEDNYNQTLSGVLNRLTLLRDQGAISSTEGVLSPAELLAAFDISTLLLWYPACKYVTGYINSQNKAFKGFYPKEALPKSVCNYLLPRALAAKSVVTDIRLAQPLLSLLNVIGESLSNIDLIYDASESSLLLTQGKVTETTPPPIPEALANAYLEQGDYEMAFTWYEKALDAIRTCVRREKVDAIVLNACLVAAKYGKVDTALRWAFTTSPLFVNIPSGLGIAGPGRSILLQQMNAWITELGFASIKEAEAHLMYAN